MEEDEQTTPNTSSVESPEKSGEWRESDSGIAWITNNLKKAKEDQDKSSSNKDTSQTDEGNQSILEDDEETFTKGIHDNPNTCIFNLMQIVSLIFTTFYYYGFHIMVTILITRIFFNILSILIKTFKNKNKA